MTHRLLLLLPWFAAVSLSSSFVQGQPADRAPRQGLEGIWNSATATPLERPAELKDTPFFTAAEAAEWERRFAERNAEPPPGSPAPRTSTGTYNTFYREFGTGVVKTLRTSIVTDPPDGRPATLQTPLPV